MIFDNNKSVFKFYSWHTLFTGPVPMLAAGGFVSASLRKAASCLSPRERSALAKLTLLVPEEAWTFPHPRETLIFRRLVEALHILQPLSKNRLVMVCPGWRETESLASSSSSVLPSKPLVLTSQWSLHPLATKATNSLFCARRRMALFVVQVLFHLGDQHWLESSLIFTVLSKLMQC